MRFYRAKYLEDKYHKAAPLKTITWHIKSMITRNKQGDAVAYDGKFTSTESVKAGSIVIADDGQHMTAYKVSAPSFGMAGIYSYYLREEAQI